MKTNSRFLALFAIIATACHAAPFAAIDDNAEIFVTGTVGFRFDDNIFMAADDPSRDLDDEVYDFTPGLQVVWGKSSAVQGTFNVSENFTEYADHDDLKDNLTSSSLNSTYDDGKMKVAFNASYNELNQNTVDTRPAPAAPVDSLIKRTVYAVGSTAELNVSEKSSVSAGFQYGQSDFERAGFSSSKTLTIPVNYYYEMTPKLDMSFGYRFRERWESVGLDAQDHFLSIGARGEFTPKLSGQIAVGVTQRDFRKPRRAPASAFPGFDDDETLPGVDASLTYAASPKTSVQFGVTNDFDTNSQGQQQKNFAVRTSVVSNISEVWAVNAGASYRSIDYYSRIDDYFEYQVGATYIVNENINVTGAISYRSNKSDLASSDFDNKVFSLAANLRY